MAQNTKLVEQIKNYATKLGLSVDNNQVQQYARALEDKIEKKNIQEPTSSTLKYVDAVQKYAESQGLAVSSAQVRKYAHGLYGLLSDVKPEALKEVGLPPEQLNESEAMAMATERKKATRQAKR